MSEKEDKDKRYEPPVIKEIGGVFEQAMGASRCVNGATFQAGDCPGGVGAQSGCPGGTLDQACLGGGSDTGGCTTGWGN